MKYPFLLFDADGTLLDFDQAEHYALSKALQDSNVSITDTMVQHYHAINLSYWKAFEQGKYTKQEITIKRFGDFFEQFQLSMDPEPFSKTYLSYLKKGGFLIDGALSTIQQLYKTHLLYIVTNGIEEVQMSRLKLAGIKDYFQHIFVSENIGVPKPHPGFFDHLSKTIPAFDSKKALIIGDSLTSDILGGIHSSIDTVWYNPKKLSQNPDICPTYEIQHLHDLLTLV